MVPDAPLFSEGVPEMLDTPSSQNDYAFYFLDRCGDCIMSDIDNCDTYKRLDFASLHFVDHDGAACDAKADAISEHINRILRK